MVYGYMLYESYRLKNGHNRDVKLSWKIYYLNIKGIPKNFITTVFFVQIESPIYIFRSITWSLKILILYFPQDN